MKSKLLFLLLISASHFSYACKCSQINVTRDLNRAYDFVIAKIISENPDTTSCNYVMDYLYEVEIEFSFKDQLTGTQKIYGGKGGGTCGSILEKDREYLIVVFKCNQGYYSTMCSATDALVNSSSQIEILNSHFGKNYQDPLLSFIVNIAVISILLLAFAGIGVLTFYKKRP